jgi:hypothetical protein
MYKQVTAHTEAGFLVGGGFKTGRLKTVIPHFYQHISFASGGAETLDHLYSTHGNSYIHTSLVLPSANLTMTLFSVLLQTKAQTGSTSDALNTEMVR